MSVTRYTNSFIQRSPITLGVAGPDQQTIGTLSSEYSVQEYWDLRMTSDSLQGVNRRRAYKVTLRQRVTIPNASAGQLGSLPTYADYWNHHYPISLSQFVQPSASPAMDFYLEGYAPKTLNSAVNTNSANDISKNNENSVQHTTGSSTSSTHTWETNGSLSLSNASSFGASGGYSDSETTTHETSDTTGATTAHGAQLDEGSTMTIKDWSAVAALDAQRQAPTWIWGQEYPWDVLQFHNVGSAGVIVPDYMLARLAADGTILCPPSNLSLTGVDFVAHATWSFLCGAEPGWGDEEAQFVHCLNYWEGAHGINQENNSKPLPQDPPPPPAAYVSLYHLIQDAAVGAPVNLNLPILSLQPILYSGPTNGASVAFSRSEIFFMGPLPTPMPPQCGIRLKSTANNLYVRGTGFDPLSGPDGVLSAPQITAKAPLTFRIYFKLTDADIELTLYLKHWKTTAAGCLMSVSVNETPTFSDGCIVRHVDSQEAGSGSNNLTAVILRRKDYRLIEFFDYLVVGLNFIDVRIEPESPAEQCGYAVRALAIG